MNLSDKWKIVVWGHLLHTHTHSYIHNGFYRAFQHLGFETLWVNKNNTENINFSNSIFFTEGQEDQNIPIRNDCFYILHNCYNEKYKQLNNKQVLKIQTYTDDILKYNMQKIEDCIYFDREGQVLYMPWATDLFPHEIDQNKPKIILDEQQREVHWVGTIGKYEFGNWKEVQKFWNACRIDNKKFVHTVLFASLEENMQKIQKSYLAPAIVGAWQKKVGYIPCRIFKNISYGKFGLTNSSRVMALFQNKLIYNDDTYKLYFSAKQKLSISKIDLLLELMDFVKDKHTYINRINTIFNCINEIDNGFYL